MSSYLLVEGRKYTFDEGCNMRVDKLRVRIKIEGPASVEVRGGGEGGGGGRR